MDFPAGRSLRLTRREDIRRVFTEGRRLGDSQLTLWGIRSSGAGSAPDQTGGPARIGVAVSKVHGKAVRRNRIKRICREAARLIRPQLPQGWDFMIVPRAGVELRLRGIQESLGNLARRLAGGGGREARP